MLKAIGDLKVARAMYEASLEMKYAIHPEGKKAKTYDIAMALTGLASVAQSLRDFDASLAYSLRALEISDSLFCAVDSFHSSILVCARNTFQAHLDAGSSYGTIHDFATDRYRLLLHGQPSLQSASTIKRSSRSPSDGVKISSVRGTEKEIFRDKHHRSVNLCSSNPMGDGLQLHANKLARVASSAANAKRVRKAFETKETKNPKNRLKKRRSRIRCTKIEIRIPRNFHILRSSAQNALQLHANKLLELHLPLRSLRSAVAESDLKQDTKKKKTKKKTKKKKKKKKRK